MSSSQDLKLRAQVRAFGAAENDKSLYRAMIAYSQDKIDSSEVVEHFLKSGKMITRCKPGKITLQSKKGSAILGPTTQGRSALYGGKRWIYGR